MLKTLGNFILKKIRKSENYKFNPNFYINVASLQYPRPTRRYCKPILHEDDVEIPIITITVGLWEW